MTRSLTDPPPVVPEPGWVPVDPFPSIRPSQSFVHEGADRFRVAYFRRGSEEVLVGRVWFGPAVEGPPGYAHGGSLAAILDEALGAVAWMCGYQVVVAHLVADFRELVPLGTDATIEAWVESVDGRKVQTRARLTDVDGLLLAEGEALCVSLRPHRLTELEERSRHS